MFQTNVINNCSKNLIKKDLDSWLLRRIILCVGAKVNVVQTKIKNKNYCTSFAFAEGIAKRLAEKSAVGEKLK